MISNESMDLPITGLLRGGKFVSISIPPDVDVLQEELTIEMQVHKYQTVQMALMLLNARLTQPDVNG